VRVPEGGEIKSATCSTLELDVATFFVVSASGDDAVLMCAWCSTVSHRSTRITVSACRCCVADNNCHAVRHRCRVRIVFLDCFFVKRYYAKLDEIKVRHRVCLNCRF
jgi:hypothetical protein